MQHQVANTLGSHLSHQQRKSPRATFEVPYLGAGTSRLPARYQIWAMPARIRLEQLWLILQDQVTLQDQVRHQEEWFDNVDISII